MQTLAVLISSSPRPLPNLQGGGASTTLSLSGTNSITFTANTIAFLLTDCGLVYDRQSGYRDVEYLTRSSSSIIGIYSVSTGKALYVNIPLDSYAYEVSSSSYSNYSNDVELAHIVRENSSSPDYSTEQHVIGSFVNKTFTLSSGTIDYYTITENTCKFSYIILG